MSETLPTPSGDEARSDGERPTISLYDFITGLPDEDKAIILAQAEAASVDPWLYVLLKTWGLNPPFSGTSPEILAGVLPDEK